MTFKKPDIQIEINMTFKQSRLELTFTLRSTYFMTQVLVKASINAFNLHSIKYLMLCMDVANVRNRNKERERTHSFQK